jgi:hypothetical protein
MKKITIILPIYKLEDEDLIMLNNAVSSIDGFHNDIKLMIVCPEKLNAKMSSINFGNKLEIKIFYNKTRKTDFINQINMGINDCDTEWFSILEIDDEYKPIWLSSMNEYMNRFTEVGVFLPIVKDVNVEGKFLNFTNESVWAYGFSNKQGYLDNEILLEFQNYQTSGGLFKTEVVKENGLFKDNIKLTFTYEFLLRLTQNSVIIMSVPRAGYQHVNFRENSLFWQYKNDEKEKMSEDEVKFWVDAAKKEYFFKNKRDIKYVKK